jgi:hypothetical protein
MSQQESEHLIIDVSCGALLSFSYGVCGGFVLQG